MRRGWTQSGVVLWLLLGCSSDSGPNAPPPGLDESGGLDHQDVSDPCLDPTQTSCPCSQPGEQIECGSVHELRGEYVICSLGTRTCTLDGWSECTPQRLEEASAAGTGTTPGGLRLQALSAAVNCKNLCDPRCMKQVDTPENLAVDGDLQADASGLTLPSVLTGGSCSHITVSPATATFTISAINTVNGAITVAPSDLSFSASCAGLPTQPRWSIDAYDRAVIDSSGKVTPFSGIGSPILVTASSTLDSSTALIDVRVQVDDFNGIASGDSVRSAFTAAALPPTVLPADVGKTLYPYKNTVFPLDLKAPLVQWDTGGTAAAGVRVALRYPAGSASPTFWYSKMFKGAAADPKEGTLATAAPAWQIPQEIWSAFDRSVAGSAGGGEILIQRYYSGAVHEMRIPVKFATESIPGTVYYTQYRRLFNTACPINPGAGTKQSCTFNPASYTIGQVCEVGGRVPTASYPPNIRAIDLSKRSAPNNDLFAGGARCPACHSISPNGQTFVDSNQAWMQSSPWSVPGLGIGTLGQTAAGLPKFTAQGNGIAPTYTGLSDTGTSTSAGSSANDYERTGENSRGFSYAAITPDGSYVLQGPNFWGNTQEYPASSSTQDGALDGLAGDTKPYFIVRTDQPGIGVQVATTAALPAHSWSAGTITGSSGSLTIDGVTLSAQDQVVLVKDEPTASHNGVYVVTNAAPWKLTRRYDADSVSELQLYTEVRVSDGKENRGRVFYVSTAPAALNSSDIKFTERVRPVSYTASPLAVDYATSGTLSPSYNLSSGSPSYLEATSNGVLKIDGINAGISKSVLVKDETNGANGIYTVSAAGSPTSKWRLTRRFDADVSSELSSRMEVRVNSGTSNAGKVFFLANSASITLDTTVLSFKQQLLPTMMVPVISPDGSRIVYVNGDADSTPGLTDTGWRKGLSMLQFEQDTLSVSRKTRLLNSWTAALPYSGIPFKWPFFESDSQSLVYVETESGEYCSSADSTTNNVDTDVERACYQGAYGSMSPTARGYWKGKLFSLDTGAATPASTRVELSKLNDGDDDGGADDAVAADHSYQPTVLPFSKGNYRWVIFTSPRPYGNQLNQASGSTPTHFTCAASMLWMAALDDVTAGPSDRSHPAFLLPGQNMGAITDVTTPHYINERGYLVPSPCKASGASCTSNSDCCGGSGGNPTAACRAPSSWTPASGPPAKTCAAIDGCSDFGESCSSTADCCGGAACVNFKCAEPPSYKSASYERTYDAECPDSYQPTWQLLSYYLTTGSDSMISFAVQTANESAALDTAPVIEVGSSDRDVVSPETPDFQDVGAALSAASSNGLNHLRLIITLVPSTDKKTAPILHDWEMRYRCEPAQ
ncbi:MAG TPA: dickkopf-related protein [Polyangiaceae bacterium]|nr:dickkopf-related protein [Polyangiaceae bacterium]